MHLDYFHNTLAFGPQLLSIINTSIKFDWLWFISQIVQHIVSLLFMSIPHVIDMFSTVCYIIAVCLWFYRV